MRLLVTDANVLIDYLVGELVAELFDLDCRLAIPDVLFAEELESHHSELIDLGLELLSLSSAAIERTAGLASSHRRVSRNDLLALALAEQERGILLTGDAALRRAARSEGVEVHGSLWLADKMWEHGAARGDRMVMAFERMKAAGRRLPWDQVESRRARWRSR